MSRFPIAGPMMAACLAVAAPPARATDLADVERALAATTTMVASFRQTADNGGVLAGTMSLKRPGKVRFDYGKEAPYLVVADGRRLSFVDYKVSQVSEWPLGSTPLGVLLDPKADLSRLARVLPEAESPIPGQIAVVAEDPERPDFGRITFFLKPDSQAPGGLLLTGWRVVDAQNRLTVVELSGSRFNVPVADSAFLFRDPRGNRAGPPGRFG